VEAAEINGGLRDVRGLVLRNKDCLRSTPLHEKEDKIPRSGGSLKRGDLVAAWRHRGNPKSNSKVRRFLVTCAQVRKGDEVACPR
jgi:hypothetical protein